MKWQHTQMITVKWRHSNNQICNISSSPPPNVKLFLYCTIVLPRTQVQISVGILPVTISYETSQPECIYIYVCVCWYICSRGCLRIVTHRLTTLAWLVQHTKRACRVLLEPHYSVILCKEIVVYSRSWAKVQSLPCIRTSSDCIATGYELDGQGSILCRDKRCFYTPQRPELSIYYQFELTLSRNQIGYIVW
jgi:hypothetical protein